MWKKLDKPNEYDVEENRGRMNILSEDEQKRLYDIICVKIDEKQFINDFNSFQPFLKAKP